MTKISKAEVQRLARLAKIALSEEETAKFVGDLEQILGYVERLQAVDTSDTATTSQVTGLEDVWRPDKPRPNPSHSELLANAPDQHKGQIKVKRVLE